MLWFYFQVRKFSHSFVIEVGTAPPYTLGLGIMSGTSCDGLDLALCEFEDEQRFNILKFSTVAYTVPFRQKLLNAGSLPASDLLLLENEFTELVAGAVLEFLRGMDSTPQYIAVHGHTIFHQPDKAMTWQMFNGGLLAERTRLAVVCDFRRQDVARGGQGAPLVPMGDRMLFSAYDACINLGGFANISFPKLTDMPAYDVTVANLLLDSLAARAGRSYDAGGALARSGEVIDSLLDELNALPFFAEAPPKSLGREWFEATCQPMFSNAQEATNHLLATAVEHVALQLGRAMQHLPKGAKALVTGGGAFNDYLMERISSHATCTVVLPERQIIEGKEALIFALLGKLRLEGRPNVLHMLTGAKGPVVAGAVYTCGK